MNELMQLDIFDKQMTRVELLAEAVAGRLFNFCSDPEDTDLAMEELDNCVCPVQAKKIYADYRSMVLSYINTWKMTVAS